MPEAGEKPGEPAEPIGPEDDLTLEDEKPARPSWARRALRWVVGLLVVFGLGFVVSLFALYLPASRELRDVRGRMVQAQAQVDAVNDQLNEQGEGISRLEADNAALRDELTDADLHVHILATLADVRSAQFALAEGEPARAKVHLTNTPETLQELEQLVGSEQMDLVTAMGDRMDLILSELEEDTFAAQSDLDVLANSLIQLENTFFAGP
jgi:hypothetical protein